MNFVGLAASIGFWLGAAAVAPQNLLPNGSFEQGVSSWRLADGRLNFYR